MNRSPLQRFQSARDDDALVVIEGFHALKHAIRFGAEILDVAVRQRSRLDALQEALAPELQLGNLPLVHVTAEVFGQISTTRIPTGVIAVARKPSDDAVIMLEAPEPAPVVFLENVRRLENIGACIRVAAAAGAAGVICTGDQDPWHPAAVRGAAGLQFALPVARLEGLPSSSRPLIAFDASGEALGAPGLPERALLAFGTEREGLTKETRAAADRVIRIPMRSQVSSLNLATAVAVGLYAWRGLAE